jgi:hypothetical protein
MIIGPHEVRTISGSGLPAAWVNKFLTPPVFSGEARYEDIFGQYHLTKYCFFIGSIDAETQKPYVGLCRHWNCADDECNADRAQYDREITAAFRKAGQSVPGLLMQR